MHRKIRIEEKHGNNGKYEKRCDSGVSEILGSVMIILIISVTIAILFAMAWPIMEDVRGNIREGGVKDAFYSFKEMVDRTLAGVDPAMSIKFPLAGGRLYTDSSTKINIGVWQWNASNGSMDLVFSTSARYQNIGRLIYDYDNKWGYVYEFGGLIKRQGSFSKVISSPRITYLERSLGHRYLSLPIVMVTGNMSYGGSGTPQVKVKVLEVKTYDFHNATLDFAIESEDNTAWYNYLNSIGMNVSIVGNQVTTFQRHYDEIHFTFYRIQVGY
ncbi:hypothetical protein DRP07_10155 [Archaeoglobales archaeon]|nr:MAG: hypothetical protein DRP07_10155 [Archaeoglobales archaeon]